MASRRLKAVLHTVPQALLKQSSILPFLVRVWLLSTPPCSLMSPSSQLSLSVLKSVRTLKSFKCHMIHTKYMVLYLDILLLHLPVDHRWTELICYAHNQEEKFLVLCSQCLVQMYLDCDRQIIGLLMQLHLKE